MAPVLLLAFLAVGSHGLLLPHRHSQPAGLALALSLINLVVMLAITNQIGALATWRQFSRSSRWRWRSRSSSYGALRAQDLGAGSSRRDVGASGRSFYLPPGDHNADQ
jgi:hypothetical protein